MEWPLLLVIIIGSLLVLMATGMPVFIAFFMINIVGIYLLFGGTAGLLQLTYSLKSSVTHFGFMPIVLFVLMGEVILRSGIIFKILDAVDKLLGRLPGRLSLASVGIGTILGTLTGAPFATIAMLGRSLVPEMEKRGYSKCMSIGPIMGSGGLAPMIPPSDLAVFLAVVAQISVAGLLMGIIMPGLVMAGIYALYIILRCRFQPSIAPSYEVAAVPMKDKLLSITRNIMPVGLIIFLVTGVIFLGIATPTEAAATGALGCFILAAAYRSLNWKMIKESLIATVDISVMLFIIVAAVKAFSQIMAASGATQGLIELAMGLPVAPIVILIIMMVILLVMGMFMEITCIMMISIPLLMPVVNALGFNQVWFGVLFLINTMIATISPPFGLSLFVMKGVAPKDTTMGDIYRASLPFCGLDILAIAVVMAFPQLATWLPSLIHN